MLATYNNHTSAGESSTSTMASNQAPMSALPHSQEAGSQTSQLPSTTTQSYQQKITLPSIHTLLSPPEAEPLDNFEMKPSSTSHQVKIVTATPPAKSILSPPATPWSGHENSAEPGGGNTTSGAGKSQEIDPPLYPQSTLNGKALFGVNADPTSDPEPAESDSSSDDDEDSINYTTEDLLRFHPNYKLDYSKAKNDKERRNISEVARIIQKGQTPGVKYIGRSHKPFKVLSTPTLERPADQDYKFIASCVPGVIYSPAGLAFTIDENKRMWAKYYRRNGDPKESLPSLKELPKLAPAPVSTARAPLPAPLKRKRVIKTTKDDESNARPIKRVRAAPTKTPRTRKPAADGAASKPKETDLNFGSIVDISPPLSTLDRLPSEWLSKQTELYPEHSRPDLSSDPYRHLLHPQELPLAAGLRLTCAPYLTAKRRIFQARVETAKEPKCFKKTDSQKACRMDVNKASKLWEAFTAVGWLDKKWIAQYLTPEEIEKLALEELKEERKNGGKAKKSPRIN